MSSGIPPRVSAIPEDCGKISRRSKLRTAAIDRSIFAMDTLQPSSTHEPADAPSPGVKRDVRWLLGIVAVFAAVSMYGDFGERFAHWTGDRERYQIDELPGVLLVLAIGLAFIAWRRASAARLALLRRQEAEQRLAAALAENQRLARANSQVQEDERRHIARELHDGLGQSLNAIKVDAKCILAGLAPGQEALRDSAAAIVAVVDDVDGSVRDLVRRLRPPGLDEFGLAGAIESCVDGWRRRLAGVSIELSIDGELDSLDEPVNIAVYRIVQESLTNVARHADARNVRIRLARVRDGDHGAAVDLAIDNDGAAPRARAATLASPPAMRGGVSTTAAGTAEGGLGLVGMRERVEALSGRFEARSLAPQGFRVRAVLPVTHRLPETA